MAFPCLSFYTSVLTIKSRCYLSEKKPESIQIDANSHLQDKQIHTTSVVRNRHFKEAECEKKIVFDFVISSAVNMQ